MKESVKSNVKNHFEELAGSYDFYKEKNYYYYNAVKKLYRELVENQNEKRVLEIGCGTGDVIASLNPKLGIGVDASEKMIGIAKKKHESIKFIVCDAENLDIQEKFDYIIMPDVIEHLNDMNKVMRNLNKIAGEETLLIISMANIIWEPILLLAEKLKLKMPEGHHYRPKRLEIKSIFHKNKFKIVDHGYRLLVPKKIPLIHYLNLFFYKIPLIKNFGLIEYFVLKKEKIN